MRSSARVDIHDGRNTNVPFKGRMQKRKTHDLQIITFGLQRAAGPYRRRSFDDVIGESNDFFGNFNAHEFGRVEIYP
jgi:hypothetical protein